MIIGNKFNKLLQIKNDTTFDNISITKTINI